MSSNEANELKIMAENVASSDRYVTRRSGGRVSVISA